MADVFGHDKRSRIMALVRGKDTAPEMVVRHITSGLGYRYRLHVRSLPGSPDLVFRPLKKLIFVHGCFWHRHSCKKGRSLPASNHGFWKEKLERNRLRDRKQMDALRRAGWNVLVIWECETRNLGHLRKRIKHFLRRATAQEGVLRKRQGSRVCRKRHHLPAANTGQVRTCPERS